MAKGNRCRRCLKIAYIWPILGRANMDPSQGWQPDGFGEFNPQDHTFDANWMPDGDFAWDMRDADP